MKTRNWTALLLLPAAALVSATATLAQTTGVSKPSADIVLTDTLAAAAKPSKAAPSATGYPRVVQVDGHKVELMSAEKSVGAPVDAMVEPPSQSAAAPADPDADVVTEVPSGRNELPQGTVLKAVMNEEVSTNGSLEGAPFAARVTEDVAKDGKVVVPAGSKVQGRITHLVAGKRISGRASIRLRADTVVLPDGSLYMLHATVIDSDPAGDNRVDSEGSIIDKGHAKRDALVAGGVTGGAAATGAVFAGAPGAVVGAGVGAGIATTHWLLEEHNAVLPKDSLVVFQLTEPMLLTPLRAENSAATDPILHEKGGR